MVEHLTFNQVVGGSNPPCLIKKSLYFAGRIGIYFYLYAGVAELADAPDLGSGGRPWGFESLHPHDVEASR